MGPFPIPTINTALLLTSGVTLTISHHALRAGHRAQTAIWLFATILLGAVFMGFQAYEYHHAYTELNLKLTSGIYGSTFFMLTGFHGFHVTMGAIMLSVVLYRVLRATSRRTTTSRLKARPGTGTLWTWSGWACTSWSTGCKIQIDKSRTPVRLFYRVWMPVWDGW
jgi:heme/copper-type cytochrome/quinol oxidase subunit 3